MKSTATSEHFRSGPRVSLGAVHIEVAQTMNELSEMTMLEIASRAAARGYLLGCGERQLTPATFARKASEGARVYMVAP